ncbi:NUDIX hydrolase [bacterium]|nr:MAG: NUDIX hydrolase [bacterium]
MDSQLFKITQNALIGNLSNEVLILRHKTGKWLLPGGKINKNETSLEGLRRELAEELFVKDFKIKGILDVNTWLEKDEGYCVITYIVELVKNQKIKLSDEHTEYVWVKRDDLHKYDFWNSKINERIEKFFQNKD